MSASVYKVGGMTCTGCANKVRNLLGELGGVDQVDVDLAAGQVAVRAARQVDDARVVEALEAAGYEAAPV
ncbi:heavy-metal-associated domain-containing protein [Micromonospora eburnea]|uniref:Copper chaperone CopZ n=1 Tax=Micromonospora eburnea TaxID=227316 RepID=A0A1C6UXM7_9ACTN|nr:heavy metal-associated domain-containing protein [Micromonospora eburnea]SCL58772.1 Copper chaperone CopZ [Micromonospora eburnea]